GSSSMGMTLKSGSGSGNYTSKSTSYVQVDGSNLAFAVTVPTGWKLLIQASGTARSSSPAAPLSFALADNGSVLVEQSLAPRATGSGAAFGLNWIVTGDGASHAIDLRFKTGNGSSAVNVANSTPTNVPVMTFVLMPSN